jgi:hypothetical protein
VRHLAVSIAAVLAGCAGAKPLPAYVEGTGENPRFPKARYLTGAGISPLGDDDAEARARSAVATQITAQIRTELTSSEQYDSDSGTRERVSQDVSVTTSFPHAELIRIVERGRSGDGVYAFAAMDRFEADRALARDGEPERERYALAVSAALAARRASNAGEFAAASRDAKEVQAAVASNLLLRRAVLGHAPSGQAEYEAQRGALEAALLDARAKRVVGVVVRGASADPRLGEYALRAVRTLGIERVEARGCAERAALREPVMDAAEVVVEPSESCAPASLGERCEIAARVVARACGSGTVGQSTLPKVVAIHPSDVAKARSAAWSKITYDAVGAAVRDALRGASAIGAGE